MITVQDILEIPDLDLHLLAGSKSTSNPVRWVHITEVPDPTKWLKGGELLLTTGYGFVGSDEQQVELLKRLIDHNISGLGFGIGFSFDKVPDSLVRVAEEYNFPLFEVPYHTPFIAITEAVASKIVNEQYSLLQRSLAVHEKLTKIVLEEKGLEAILADPLGARGLFGRPLRLPRRGAQRGRLPAAPRSELIADLWRQISDRRANRKNFALGLEGVGSGVQVYPVVASHRIGAFLAVVKDSGDFSDYDRIILHHVVTVTALELVKKKAVAETEKRLAGDFFDELIASDLYEEEIARRLAFFGLDPRVPHLIILVDVDGLDGSGNGSGEREDAAAQDLKERLHWAVDEFMAKRDALFISAARSDEVVILVQPGKHDVAAVMECGREMQQAVAQLLPRLGGLRGHRAHASQPRRPAGRATTRPAMPSRSAGSRAVLAWSPASTTSAPTDSSWACRTRSRWRSSTTASSASSTSTTSRTRATWSRVCPASSRPTATGATPPRSCTCIATRCATA